MGQIDEAELAGRIVREVIGERTTDVTQIVDKGATNLVFVVTTAERRVIVRMRDEFDALREYKKEAWCSEQGAALGIPGPTVLAVGTLGTMPYTIQSFVPGVNGADASGESLHIWRQLGRYARLLHSVRLPASGDTLSEDEHALFGDGNSCDWWPRYIAYNLECLTPSDNLLALGVYSPEQRDSINAIFEGLKSTVFASGLNHRDLSLRNTIIDSDGCVSLLDWGSAEIGFVPEADVAIVRGRHADDENMDAFMEGYGYLSDELSRMLPQLEAYQLINSFDLVRWSTAHRPEELPSYVLRAKTALRQALHLPRL